MKLLNQNGVIRKKFSDDEFYEICSLTPWVKDITRNSIRERVHCILNDIGFIPKCPECQKNVNFLNSGRYGVYCSSKCSANSKSVKEKHEETCLINFGVSCNLKLESNKSVSKQTSVLRYGKEYPSQSETVQEKMKNTCVERFGVDNVFKSEEVKTIIKQTMNERYGVDYSAQSPILLKKTKETTKLRFGTENPLHSQESKDKMSISHAVRYQEMRNLDGTDFKGVVYILHFRQHNAIKIGLSSDFSQRSKELKKDFGEFEILELIESNHIKALETELHEKYSNYRICLNEGIGRTEFFKEEILDLLTINKV